MTAPGNVPAGREFAGRGYDLTGIGIYDFVRNFRKAVGRGLDPAAAQFGRRGFGVCRTRTRCM